MPAWSVPGIQSTRSPRIRCQRMRMSLSVCSNMWPMCRLPVTLGGGSRIVKAGLLPGAGAATPSDAFRASEGGVGCANSFSRTQYSAHLSSMAVGSYALGRSWGMELEDESPGIARASFLENCEREDQP